MGNKRICGFYPEYPLKCLPMRSQWIDCRNCSFYHSKGQLSKSVMVHWSYYIRLLWCRIASQEQASEVFSGWYSYRSWALDVLCRVCSQQILLEIIKTKLALKNYFFPKDHLLRSDLLYFVQVASTSVYFLSGHQLIRPFSSHCGNFISFILC